MAALAGKPLLISILLIVLLVTRSRCRLSLPRIPIKASHMSSMAPMLPPPPPPDVSRVCTCTVRVMGVALLPERSVAL
jgi:hypothetical protein